MNDFIEFVGSRLTELGVLYSDPTQQAERWATVMQWEVSDVWILIAVAHAVAALFAWRLMSGVFTGGRNSITLYPPHCHKCYAEEQERFRIQRMLSRRRWAARRRWLVSVCKRAIPRVKEALHWDCEGCQKNH